MGEPKILQEVSTKAEECQAGAALWRCCLGVLVRRLFPEVMLFPQNQVEQPAGFRIR